MRSIRAFGGWVARTARDQGGAIAVEFGIVAPMLAVIIVPLVDLGMGAYRQMQVEAAAQAGAEYAAVHGWDSTGIQNVVTGATGLSGISASPAPSQSCGCASGTTLSNATCGSTCADGSTAGSYVTVNAQVQYTTLFTYPALGSPLTLSAQTMVRIQ